MSHKIMEFSTVLKTQVPTGPAFGDLPGPTLEFPSIPVGGEFQSPGVDLATLPGTMRDKLLGGLTFMTGGLLLMSGGEASGGGVGGGSEFVELIVTPHVKLVDDD